MLYALNTNTKAQLNNYIKLTNVKLVAQTNIFPVQRLSIQKWNMEKNNQLEIHWHKLTFTTEIIWLHTYSTTNIFHNGKQS